MLAPGRLLQDRYEIVASVARGGVGAVYQALDHRLGHTVAVKQIIHNDAALRAAFEQEARLLAKLRHPALPTVTDHFVEETGQFLVMEYVPGDDLATLAMRQREPLAVETVLRWADQLLDVLTYLHSQTPPIIHRDIKPHNLKLNAQGAVMLLDFGLAKGVPVEVPAARSLAGYTLHYAPPEQLRGEPSDATSDLYALAATLYDLLTSTKPPDALKRLAAIASGLPDPLEELSARNPEVSRAVAEIIQQALALSPRVRFPDASAMRLALHAAGGEATQIVARPESSASEAPAHNLPVQLTSFVARDAEVTAVHQLLLRNDVRLVTLTGPGGIGKTRLALTVAMRSLGEFTDGVFFVPLAAINDAALVLPAVAQNLGLREAANTTVGQNLDTFLQDKQLLLLLDNFEQVVSAAPQISALLSSAPRLKILITSRETLQVRGEQEFPVPVLALPDTRQLPAPEALGDFAAIRLFVQRAQAVKPDFALHEGNAAAVAELCRRLDGLPLAIELAAASVKVLPVQAILARFAERFDLPHRGQRDLPDRQRTLAASIGWSYDLLSDEEKALFRRLCVFSGSFDLEGAEALCAQTGLDAMLALETITALVAKSLIKPHDDGAHEPRFTMLETIRDFGLKQLEDAGEGARVRAAYAAYYDQLVQEAERSIWGAAVAQWVSRLDVEIENVRAALSYYLADDGGAAAALRLAGSLWRFWEIRGYIFEGRVWLARALERRDQVPPAQRWLPLHGAGNLAADQGDYVESTAHYQEALELLQGMLFALQDPHEKSRTHYAIGNTLTNLGHTKMLQSHFREAIAFSEEAIQKQRMLLEDTSNLRFNPKVGLALPVTNLALIYLYQGDYAQSEAYCREGLALYRELGDERGLGWNLHTLGCVVRDRGDYEQAAKLLSEAQLLFEKLSNQADMVALHFDLGELARLQGHISKALVSYQTGLALARELGVKRKVAEFLDRLSLLDYGQGNYASALALADESLALQREIDNTSGLSDALATRGHLALAQQNLSEAGRYFAESLEIKARLGDRKGIVDLLKALASLMLVRGDDAARAVCLIGAAEALRVAIGIHVPPSAQAADEVRVEALAARLCEEAFARAWAEGQALDWQQAVVYALEAR